MRKDEEVKMFFEHDLALIAKRENIELTYKRNGPWVIISFQDKTVKGRGYLDAMKEFYREYYDFVE